MEKLDIDFARGSSFLPYAITQFRFYDDDSKSRPMAQPCQVFRKGCLGSNSEMWISAINKRINANAPAAFCYWDDHKQEITKEQNLHCDVTDYRVLFDKDQGSVGFIASGYRSDSVFVFCYYYETDKLDSVFLISRAGTPVNGEWTPGINFRSATDYDFDGKTEMFFFIGPSYQTGPRVLYCIEPEPLHVEWSLPVASSITAGPFSCWDLLNPSVIFTSYGPQNGAADANFSDENGYLTKVNNRGQIMFNKVTSDDLRMTLIIPKTGDKPLFYLYHALPMDEPKSADSSSTNSQILSIIDGECEVIKSVPVSEELSSLWESDFQGDPSLELYTLSCTGVIRIYDNQLHLLAESNRTDLRTFVDTIRLVAQPRSAFIFLNSVTTTDIYSYDLYKLASVNGDYLHYDPLTFDAQGNITRFILGHTNKFMIASINKRQFQDYVKIVFWEYQSYILMCLSAFVVGIVLMNYYRSKARKNLNLITQQKKELEQVHQELKDAQAKIIAHEKYQQAKDIAGGVAHEIHNALCPALNSLDKLRERLCKVNTSEADRNSILIALTEKAINRAINMTELVKTYSKLESEKRLDLVNLKGVIEEVIEANRLRIQELSVLVQTEIPPECKICCARIHAYSLFNNLMINALDALVDVKERLITIVSRTKDRMLEIEFSDTGVGIEPDSLNRIFEPFYSTKPHAGTGLGLTMVKKIVELYGGGIRAFSELDRGTKFIILLPKEE